MFAMELGLGKSQEPAGDGTSRVDDFYGRLYHDEHFAHGVLLGHGDAGAELTRKVTAGGLNGAANGVMHAHTKDFNRAVTGQGHVAPNAITLGTPMPKWPAGHQSAAFESVAVKRSFILSPAEIFAECAHHGEEKAKFPWYKIWILTIIAGCYVGFGFTTCLLVGGMLQQAPEVGTPEQYNYGIYKLIFGAVGFPFAFTTIVVCGAELYTSLCAYMTAAWWEGKVTVLTCIRMLVISWTGNFLGCALMAGLLCASEIYHGKTTTLFYIAHDKVSHGWGATLVKGIFANWLVGIATWMANAAQDLTGKAIGIWLPIAAFGMLGFEHCIANMFLFVMAWCEGAHITAKQFIWYNLVPSTIGNYIGGGVCLATVYAFAFGRTPKLVGEWVDQKMKRH